MWLLVQLQKWFQNGSKNKVHSNECAAALANGSGGPAMGMFSESVEVDCSSAGIPVSLLWQGCSYTIGPEPVRWYERRSWWEEEIRAEVGRGPGLVDHEIWRVQARAGGKGPAWTFDLSHHLGSNRWRLLRLHDAVRPRSA
jgi:hypothetical protein